jgi:3-oxoacyl-(acyl-carrier-protein) synthase
MGCTLVLLATDHQCESHCTVVCAEGGASCVTSAGTALGDPVEVNAAAEALVVRQQRSQPVVLVASKAWYGHSEPAAGLVAVQHASVAATAMQQLPMLHLCSLNPYVGGILDMLAEQAAGTGMSAARQAAPLLTSNQLTGEDYLVNSSISSFAFMGESFLCQAIALPKHFVLVT